MFRNTKDDVGIICRRIRNTMISLLEYFYLELLLEKNKLC